MHFCSNFKGFEAVSQGKFDVTGNLAFQLFQLMSKLSKVKRKYLKLACTCCDFEASTGELIFLAYFGEEQF